MSSMARISPFTRTVVASMRHLFPEDLADKSFDNTGLLLESPLQPSQSQRNSNRVLLTIDLTKAVADEAVAQNVSLVVAYHPIIFRGLKSITFDDPQQATLLRLASHGISVYSPHTAVDQVPGGMADWLCDIVTGKVEPEPEGQVFTVQSGDSVREQQPASQPTTNPTSPSDTDVTTSEDEDSLKHKTADRNGSADPFTDSPQTSKTRAQQRKDAAEERPRTFHRTYSKPTYHTKKGDLARTPSPIQTTSTTTFFHSIIPHKRKVISPSPSSALAEANHAAAADALGPSSTESEPYSSENTGAGRLITFDSPQALATLITRIANAIGQPKGFPVAVPQETALESIQIKTVGLCPGSGASVLSGLGSQWPPDLVFTGEMSHHDALAVIERGGSVITLFHSNSERGYLETVMKPRLEADIKDRWNKARNAEGEDENDFIMDILRDENVEVIVSERDRDPYGIVVLQESRAEGQEIG